MFKRMDSFGVFDYIETSEGTYEYSAAKMREQFAGLVGNGVLKGIDDQFNASATGLQVTIGTGEGWLLGVHGKMITTSAFTLDPVVSGMSKIVSLVLDVDIPNQLFGISILAGTQAASPSAPQITQSETRYQQVIWQARVHDDGTITLSDFRTYLIRPGDGATKRFSIAVTATWSGSAAPYTQEVNIEGVTADMEGSYGIVYNNNDTLATRIAQDLAFSMLSDFETASGKVILTCFESKPTTAYNLRLEVHP